MDEALAKRIISIIVILGYITSGLSFLAGIVVICLGVFGRKILYELVVSNMQGMMVDVTHFVGVMGNIMIIVGAFGIIFSLVGFLVYYSLARYHNWARWIVIIGAGLGIIVQLFLMNGLLTVVCFLVYAFLIYFFAFEHAVREIFESKSIDKMTFAGLGETISEKKETLVSGKSNETAKLAEPMKKPAAKAKTTKKSTAKKTKKTTANKSGGSKPAAKKKKTKKTTQSAKTKSVSDNKTTKKSTAKKTKKTTANKSGGSKPAAKKKKTKKTTQSTSKPAKTKSAKKSTKKGRVR